MIVRPFMVGHVEHERGDTLIVRAGHRGFEHVVPPAGEDYAFDRELWARRIEISVSPKHRSVRVWVDGEEVVPSTAKRGGMSEEPSE